MKLTANNSAVILYLLALLLTLGLWYLLVFEGKPSDIKPINNVIYFLNEPPTQLIFWWLLVSPVLYLLLAIAYFSEWSLTSLGALILFATGAVLTIAAWWSSPSPIAITVSFALWYSFVAMKPHLSNCSSETPNGAP
jgi:hypothetical protein